MLYFISQKLQVTTRSRFIYFLTNSTCRMASFLLWFWTPAGSRVFRFEK